jgi:hypothetical protein
MIKNNDFILFRAIADTLSAAFAPTVGAKSNISVKPVQALVWAVKYLLRSL